VVRPVVCAAPVAHVTRSVVGTADLQTAPLLAVIGAAPVADMAGGIVGTVLGDGDDGSRYGESKSGADRCCETSVLLHVELLVGYVEVGGGLVGPARGRWS
jgi:hypothetical protein